jgi:hypothetical protein
MLVKRRSIYTLMMHAVCRMSQSIKGLQDTVQSVQPAGRPYLKSAK